MSISSDLLTTNKPDHQPGHYHLPLIHDEPTKGESQKEMQTSLLIPLYAQNTGWYCRLRWIVTAIFVAFGVLGLFPEVPLRLGLNQHTHWAFVIAAILAAGNTLFVIHLRFSARHPGATKIRTNLWAQIIFDIVIVTIVIHYLGRTNTEAASIYLIHIVLACIFFRRLESFIVVLAASFLYLGCMFIEGWGWDSTRSIFLHSSAMPLATSSTMIVLDTVSRITIFFVVWYLASRLSRVVRNQERELAESNRRLLSVQREKSRHMLRTTHELKAPFAAIHAQAQLLDRGLCGPLPEEAQKVVTNISERARRLAHEIQEMLQLANLSSEDAQSLEFEKLDLVEILKWCLAQVEQVALEFKVDIDHRLEPAHFNGIEDHLKMLFTNLLANAVVYSHAGSTVEVRCGTNEKGYPEVSIKDYGIGIPQEKLPHIFDEYYRTEEAVLHNKESTGLGLPIVRQVALRHRISVDVRSCPGKGTEFVLRFPKHLMAQSY